MCSIPTDGRASIVAMQSERAMAIEAVTSAFTSVAPFFKLYSTYCQSYEGALQALQEALQRDPAFARFCMAAQQSPRCRGLPLEAYLIKPIQRICKYPLFFAEMKKHAPHGSDTMAALLQALHGERLVLLRC